MTAVVIAARELRARTRFFLLCSAFAVLPFLAALLSAARGDASTVIAMIGGSLALVMAFGSAVTLGANAVGHELGERRLSFYFARPISPAALWAGKACASAAVFLGAFAIIAVPAMLGAWDVWFNVWPVPFLVKACAIVIVTFLLAHALGTMIRSRSALIALDFLLAVVVLGIGAAALYPLLVAHAVQDAGAIAVACAIGIIVILAVAPVWQLANGRTDARRNHVAFARAFWPPLFVLVLAAAAYAWWIVSASPLDFTRVALLDMSPTGEWMLATGVAPGRGDYQPTLIANVRDGRFRRLAAPPYYGIAYARDGQTMAWMQPSGPSFDAPRELFVLHLADRRARPLATGIRVDGVPHFTLSDDGTRVAIADARTLAVHDLAAARLVASVPVSTFTTTSLFFATPDVVRLVGVDVGGTAGLRVSELDLRTRELRTTGELHAPVAPGIRASSDGSRLLVNTPLRVLDGRTAAVVADPRITAAQYSRAMLADGSFVVVTGAAKNARLSTFDANGAPGVEVVLPGVVRAGVSAELPAHRLVLTSYTPGQFAATGKGTRVFVVDLQRGVIEHVIDGVRCPIGSEWNGADPRARIVPAGMPLPAVDEAGKLILVDPATGARRAFPS
ncbi:MAG: hypothetical protein JO197_19110 [Acidobacteria bacterium]|nr:hypothetical protein [Acidobacteriota bacterium]MBV9477084.1 hypothetical protein [Acidobacteriota bacterium]